MVGAIPQQDPFAPAPLGQESQAYSWHRRGHTPETLHVPFNPDETLTPEVLKDVADYYLSLATVAARYDTTLNALLDWLSSPDIKPRVPAARWNLPGVVETLPDDFEHADRMMRMYREGTPVPKIAEDYGLPAEAIAAFLAHPRTQQRLVSFRALEDAQDADFFKHCRRTAAKKLLKVVETSPDEVESRKAASTLFRYSNHVLHPPRPPRPGSPPSPSGSAPSPSGRGQGEGPTSTPRPDSSPSPSGSAPSPSGRGQGEGPTSTPRPDSSPSPSGRGRGEGPSSAPRPIDAPDGAAPNPGISIPGLDPTTSAPVFHTADTPTASAHVNHTAATPAASGDTGPDPASPLHPADLPSCSPAAPSPTRCAEPLPPGARADTS